MYCRNSFKEAHTDFQSQVLTDLYLERSQEISLTQTLICKMVLQIG